MRFWAYQLQVLTLSITRRPLPIGKLGERGLFELFDKLRERDVERFFQRRYVLIRVILRRRWGLVLRGCLVDE